MRTVRTRTKRLEFVSAIGQTRYSDTGNQISPVTVRRPMNETSKFRSMMLALGLTLAVLPLKPDVVELRNGQRLEGAFKQATAMGLLWKLAVRL